MRIPQTRLSRQDSLGRFSIQHRQIVRPHTPAPNGAVCTELQEPLCSADPPWSTCQRRLSQMCGPPSGSETPCITTVLYTQYQVERPVTQAIYSLLSLSRSDVPCVTERLLKIGIIRIVWYRFSPKYLHGCATITPADSPAKCFRTTAFR